MVLKTYIEHLFAIDVAEQQKSSDVQNTENEQDSEATDCIYYNAINKLVDRVLFKLGIYDSDKEDYYSCVNEELAKLYNDNTYDTSNGKVEGYIYTVIKNTVIDTLRSKNALKRNLYVKDSSGNLLKLDPYSLDAPMSDDTSECLGDSIADNRYDLEAIVEKNNGFLSDNMTAYLKSLTRMQRRILLLKADGKSIDEITEILHISKKRYNNDWDNLKTFEHISLLYQRSSSYQGK